MNVTESGGNDEFKRNQPINYTKQAARSGEEQKQEQQQQLRYGGRADTEQQFGK